MCDQKSLFVSEKLHYVRMTMNLLCIPISRFHKNRKNAFIFDTATRRPCIGCAVFEGRPDWPKVGPRMQGDDILQPSVKASLWEQPRNCNASKITDLHPLDAVLASNVVSPHPRLCLGRKTYYSYLAISMDWCLPLVELNPRSSLQRTLANVGKVS